MRQFTDPTYTGTRLGGDPAAFMERVRDAYEAAGGEVGWAATCEARRR